MLNPLKWGVGWGQKEVYYDNLERGKPPPRSHPLTSAITATGQSLRSVVSVVTSVRLVIFCLNCFVKIRCFCFCETCCLLLSSSSLLSLGQHFYYNSPSGSPHSDPDNRFSTAVHHPSSSRAKARPSPTLAAVAAL